MGTTATVTLGTAIQDLAGNALAAPFMFTFMTLSDTTAPTVTSTTPVANNPNTPLTSSVVITFSEPVTNVTTSTFIVDDGSPVSGTLSSSSMGRTWTFTPTNQLAGMAMVTVTLSTGIRDLASNALAAPFAYMFMTVADTFPPTLQSSVPASGATGVSTTATVSVTFNEPATNVNGSTFVVSTGGGVFVIPGTYVSSNGGRTWTYTPNFPYSAAAAVGVSLKAGIQDLLGNATTADMNFSFMTQ
jgi:methionine-rich copper-binding protein CopC